MQLVGGPLSANPSAVEVAFGLERTKVVAHWDVVLAADGLKAGRWVRADDEDAFNGGIERNDRPKTGPTVVVRVRLEAEAARVLAEDALPEFRDRRAHRHPDPLEISPRVLEAAIPRGLRSPESPLDLVQNPPS